MKRTAMLVGLILFLNTGVPSGILFKSGKFFVTAIHAYLYYQPTGKISTTDLLDGERHVLWNTIIGEGEARMPSRALLVLVDLAGPTFADDSGGRLVLQVTDGVKTLLNQTLLLDDWFSDGQKLVLPFIVYGTGCRTIEIAARLEGLPDEMVGTAILKKTVPFECGE